MFLQAKPVIAADSVKIVINKKVNKLAYIKNGAVVKVFPVATGKTSGLTPEGNFKVVRKLVNPYYNKKKIPGGSSRNPLGVRWLGFDACGTSGGTYGIHGTNSPKSIGKYVSGGCIRMLNKDVIWLYDNTPLKTPVEIINKDWDLEQKPVNIQVNGTLLSVDDQSRPYMERNRVLVPCRLVAESMGCTVDWDPVNQLAVISRGGNMMSMEVNSGEINVNGRAVQTEVKPVLKNGKLFVWVRNLAETFGYNIAWKYSTYTVMLTNGG